MIMAFSLREDVELSLVLKFPCFKPISVMLNNSSLS
jgi:hypothetical protein